MIRSISQALADIIQLRNVSDCHAKECKDPNCGVSLFQLQGIAVLRSSSARPDELKEIKDLIDGWPR